MQIPQYPRESAGRRSYRRIGRAARGGCSPIASTGANRHTGPMAQRAHAVLQGTMDLLILKALSLEPTHGWGISERIRGISRGAFQVGQGTLYPALHRY